MFASILPGIREARNPLVIGSLWIAAYLLFLHEHVAAFPKSATYIIGQQIFEILPKYVGPASLAVSAYLVGIISEAASRYLWNRTRALQPPTWLLLRKRTGQFLARRTNRRNQVSGMLQASLLERLPSEVTPVASFISSRLLTTQFEMASLSLAKSSTEQYQQWDRLRAEGDFRIGIAPPLFVCAVGIASSFPFFHAVLIVLLGATTSIVLLNLGTKQHDRADEILAGALYFSYASIPLLDSLTKSATEFVKKVPSPSRAESLAWLFQFLYSRKWLNSSDTELHSRLIHPANMGSQDFHKAIALLNDSTRFILLGMLTDKQAEYVLDRIEEWPNEIEPADQASPDEPENLMYDI